MAFWDFYALEYLYSWLSRSYGINQKKLDYIRELYEKTTYGLFRAACDALERSVRWEIRHAFDHIGTHPKKRKEATKQILRIFNLKKVPSRGRMPLEMISLVFSLKKTWLSSFGGKSWADATELLIKAKPYLEQYAPDKWSIYLDGIFDLEHNTGFVLNKTEFQIISETDLDVRHRLTSIKAFLGQGISKKVENLIFANMQYLPAAPKNQLLKISKKKK